MATVCVGDVVQLRPGCFYCYFRKVSTFASLVRHVWPSAGRKSANAVDGQSPFLCFVTLQPPELVHTSVRCWP